MNILCDLKYFNDIIRTNPSEYQRAAYKRIPLILAEKHAIYGREYDEKKLKILLDVCGTSHVYPISHHHNLDDHIIDILANRDGISNRLVRLMNFSINEHKDPKFTLKQITSCINYRKQLGVGLPIESYQELKDFIVSRLSEIKTLNEIINDIYSMRFDEFIVIYNIIAKDGDQRLINSFNTYMGERLHGYDEWLISASEYRKFRSNVKKLDSRPQLYRFMVRLSNRPVHYDRFIKDCRRLGHQDHELEDKLKNNAEVIDIFDKTINNLLKFRNINNSTIIQSTQ